MQRSVSFLWGLEQSEISLEYVNKNFLAVWLWNWETLSWKSVEKFQILWAILSSQLIKYDEMCFTTMLSK